MISRIFPAEFMNDPAYFRSLTLGAVYLFFLIMQLFTFERFPNVFAEYGSFFVTPSTAFVVTLLELAALPALFSMRMSRLAWLMSRIAVVAVAGVWLSVSLLGALSGYSGNVGLLGATLEPSNGWWFLMFMAILSLTAVLIARELPHRHS